MSGAGGNANGHEPHGHAPHGARAHGLGPEFAARVLRDVAMSKHTSWHVGGPADLFFSPRDIMDLASFLRQLPPDMPVLWIGLGSNLLVRDGGIRGAVVSTQGALAELERASATRIRAGAGVPCARIARQCVKWGLGPAEFFAGIPGTLGGALAMNAGAFGGETWRHVVEVEVLDRRGVRHVRTPAEYRIAYRSVAGPADEWFIAARLEFDRRPGINESAIRELLEKRRQSQPIGEWSCGSVFTNPPGEHAARLIEAAGLKGYRIGDASVSSKHANFIINHGNATAADIEALIRYVQRTVAEQHHVELTTEVRIVGEPA
ncbi:MAG: UDP-N-acetylmuramate dehydrogenase [Steroidobacteraceae bacterium]|jgi:UDP-N-acetylmuramate dehydrogenase